MSKSKRVDAPPLLDNPPTQWKNAVDYTHNKYKLPDDIRDISPSSPNESHVIISISAHGGFETNEEFKKHGKFDEKLAENVIIWSAAAPGSVAFIDPDYENVDLYTIKHLLWKNLPVVNVLNHMRQLYTLFAENLISKRLNESIHNPLYKLYKYAAEWFNTPVSPLLELLKYVSDKYNRYKDYNTIPNHYGIYKTNAELTAHNESIYENLHASVFTPDKEIMYGSDGVYEEFSDNDRTIALIIRVLDVRHPINNTQYEIIGKDNIFDAGFLEGVVTYTDTNITTRLSKVLEYFKKTLKFKHVTIFSFACRYGEQHDPGNVPIKIDETNQLTLDWAMKRHDDNYAKVSKHMEKVGYAKFGGSRRRGSRRRGSRRRGSRRRGSRRRIVTTKARRATRKI